MYNFKQASMKKTWLLTGPLTLLVLIACTKNKEDPDYRDKFCGRYSIIQYYRGWSMGDPVTSYSYDTLETIAVIDKFMGYTCPNGSNYYNIEQKLGVRLSDDFTFDSHSSICNDTSYYIVNYLHPTVNFEGILTYPEFTCDVHAHFSGYIRNNSLYIEYYYNGLGFGYCYLIHGVKLN